MKMQNYIGLATLVVGVIFLVYGMNASHSLSDRLNNSITGRFTDATTWYIIVGMVVALAGAYMMFFSRG